MSRTKVSEPQISSNMQRVLFPINNPNLTSLYFLSAEQVISGLDIAAATMQKGEQAVLIIHPDYGFRDVEVRRDLSLVPPCSTLTYEVEMLDCIKVVVR